MAYLDGKNKEGLEKKFGKHRIENIAAEVPPLLQKKEIENFESFLERELGNKDMEMFQYIKSKASANGISDFVNLQCKANFNCKFIFVINQSYINLSLII